MRTAFLYFFALIVFLGLKSCKDNRWQVDTSSVNWEMDLKRFDLRVLELSKDGLNSEEFNKLKKENPRLLPLYISGVMQFDQSSEKRALESLNRFLQNKDIINLFQEVQNEYKKGSLDPVVSEIDQGFKAFKHYFPNKPLPELASMVSAFNYSTVVDDSLLVIGLDMYLGAQYTNYKKAGIPQYKYKNYEKNYMVSDALKAWIFTEFEEDGSRNLLEEMIFQGKIIYLLNAFLPERELMYFLNYDAADIEWCVSNESEIWYHFVDMELFYISENFTIRKYLGDAPFIAGFPEGSPGRVGIWLGYQIVNAFMDEQNQTTLPELMATDPNKILQRSNFKPKRN